MRLIFFSDTRYCTVAVPYIVLFITRQTHYVRQKKSFQLTVQPELVNQKKTWIYNTSSLFLASCYILQKILQYILLGIFLRFLANSVMTCFIYILNNSLSSSFSFSFSKFSSSSICNQNNSSNDNLNDCFLSFELPVCCTPKKIKAKAAFLF